MELKLQVGVKILLKNKDGKYLILSDNNSSTFIINLENGVKTKTQISYNISKLDDGTLYNTEFSGGIVSQIDIVADKIQTKSNFPVSLQPVLRFNMSAFAVGKNYYIAKGEIWDVKTRKRVSRCKLESAHNIDSPQTYHGHYMVYKFDV